MAPKKDLLGFLFGESAESEAVETARGELNIAENLERLFEAAAEAEKGELESKKTPLAKALGEIGIEGAGEDLELDTEGFVLCTDNHQRYVDAITVLGSADAMHRLAEMGWVVTKPGDDAMTNEPANYRIRFLEINTVEADDREPKPGYDTSNREEVIKKAQEFASTPMDREDEMNPVENEDGKMGKRNTGVGEPKDGSDPEGKPKGSTGKVKESQLDEFTSTGSMGTAMSQGQPFIVPPLATKGKGGSLGGKFKTPRQWKMKQPVVDAQVKRRATSESEESVDQRAEHFLNEAGPGEIPPGTFGNPGEPEYFDEPEEFEEPQEEDITTGDHHTFYQVGATRGPWLEVPQDWDWDETAEAIREKMKEEGFFPNVWFISDHGNAHLITDLWPPQAGQEPDASELPPSGDEDSPDVQAKWLDHMDKPRQE